jgi:hypothetical protein
MARGCWAVAVAVLMLVSAGCGLSRPRWFFPGRVEQQQDRAVYYDPYPDQEVGPKVEGGRPREYQQQVPTAVRSQPQGPWGNWQLTP